MHKLKVYTNTDNKYSLMEGENKFRESSTIKESNNE